MSLLSFSGKCIPRSPTYNITSGYILFMIIILAFFFKGLS